MMPTAKTRTSVSLVDEVTVDTRQVDVAVEGLDASAIPGSFSVHLLRDGKRIASRAIYQPSAGAPGSDGVAQCARFDFVMDIAEVAHGELSIDVEPVDPSHRSLVSPEVLGHATLSVYLLLELRSNEHR